MRLRATTSAKLLVIEEQLRGFVGLHRLLAITDKAREGYGRVFPAASPHIDCVRGTVVMLFIFLHHSVQLSLELSTFKRL